MEIETRASALHIFTVGVLTVAVVAGLLRAPQTSFAQTSECSKPSFYSMTLTPAILNTPWSLPLLSTIDGTYTTTVNATGLPPGVTLQDQKTTITNSTSVLHNWVLSGSPTQLGTYTINVTAQNSCGGASTVITLPINNTTTAPATAACPTGTTGTYPNCVSSTAATVSFDASSLTTSSTSPTITGNSNTQTVSLTVQNNVGTTIFTSSMSSVVGGRWSIMVPNLVTGLYKLYLYSNSLLLISGDLKITSSSNTTSVSAVSQNPAQNSLTRPEVSQPSSVSGISTSSGSSCAILLSNMQLGSRGNDVVLLQGVLIQKGLLAPGSATGYFGTQTRAAVQQLQRVQGIASSGDETTTGFGMVGARTRAALALGCGGIPTPPTTVTPSADPITTPTPSRTIVCPNYPRPVCGTGGTQIAMGYDSNGCFLGYQCFQTQAQQDSYFNSYQSQYTQPTNSNQPFWAPVACLPVTNPTCTNGTLVSLGNDYNGCSMGSYCQQNFPTPTSIPTPPTPTPTPTTTMTCPTGTTGTYPFCTYTPLSSASLSASPTSGSGPLAVQFTARGNGLSYFGGYNINYGDGSQPAYCGPFDPLNCPSHTYFTPGTFIAQLYGVGESVGGAILGSATITVGGGTTPTPTPTPTSATLRPPTVNRHQCSSDGTSVTLSWGSVSGAQVYSVRVDYVANNASTCLDGWYCDPSKDVINDNLTGTTYTASITPNVEYQWWVHSKYSSTWTGVSPFEGRYSFTCYNFRF